MIDATEANAYNAQRMARGDVEAADVLAILSTAMTTLGADVEVAGMDEVTPAMVTAAAASFQIAKRLVVDGKFGDETMAALRQNNSSWPVFSPSGPYPRKYADLEKVFGTPGPKGSAFERDSIVYCVRHLHGDRPPLPGQMPSRWVGVHVLVEPHLRLALARAAQASPIWARRYPSGCVVGGYVYRRMRGSSKRALSIHSWGAAVDVEPADNHALLFDSLAEVPRPWSPEWMKIWPGGVTAGVVAAFRSCGFRWGGHFATKEDPFVDPMHFEWVGVG